MGSMPPRLRLLLAALVVLAAAAARPQDPQDPAIRALREASSLKVRTQAALVLGQRGGREAIGALREALVRDEAAAVRMAAATALGRIGDPAAREVLVKAQAEDRDRNVREAAGRALVEIATRERELPPARSLVIEDALGSAGDPTARQALRDALGRQMTQRGFSVVAADQPAAYRIKSSVLALEVAESGNKTVVAVRASAIAVDGSGRMTAMLEGSARLRADGSGLSRGMQARLSVQAIEAAASSLSEDLAAKLQ
jgi:HEAT repeat protein